jgi:hypothetical protein
VARAIDILREKFAASMRLVHNNLWNSTMKPTMLLVLPVSTGWCGTLGLWEGVSDLYFRGLLKTLKLAGWGTVVIGRSSGNLFSAIWQRKKGGNCSEVIQAIRRRSWSNGFIYLAGSSLLSSRQPLVASRRDAGVPWAIRNRYLIRSWGASAVSFDECGM